MSRSILDLSADDLDEFAREAWKTAAQEALARGLPVTGSRDGRRFRYHPDGREEDLGPVTVQAATSAAPPVVEAKAQLPRFDVREFEMPKFEVSKFEFPKFELPKLEIPLALREWAEKGIAQAREGYERGLSAAAEEATKTLEDTYANATKGYTDYNLKVIELARLNTNAAFDYASELLAVKSLSEMMELASTHACKQAETLTTQARELSALAQKVATETADPIKTGVSGNSPRKSVA